MVEFNDNGSDVFFNLEQISSYKGNHIYLSDSRMNRLDTIELLKDSLTSNIESVVTSTKSKYKYYTDIDKLPLSYSISVGEPPGCKLIMILQSYSDKVGMKSDY